MTDSLDGSTGSSAGEGGRPALDRRRFLAGSAAAVTAATALPLAAAGPASAATRPNVLLIITDDQPKQTEWALQNTVNWLAGQGVRFTNGHVTTPLCSPSRSSVLSGRYAHNHGVRNNSASHRLDQSTTVQHYLRQAGYRTGLFGKYLNSWDINDSPPHFEEFALLRPGYVDGTYNVNGTVQTINGYTTTVIRNRTLRFLDRAATDPRPWFALVTPYASHGPRTPEERYAGTAVPDWNGRPSVPETNRADKPPYIQNATGTLAEGRAIRAEQLRTLRSVDDAVQAFRERLASLGQLENTLVIYIADNGFGWADHGWTRKSVPYRPAHEVPFYLSWPAGGLGAGVNDSRIVANIDIAPTILDAAGIAPAVPQDGRSLLGAYSRDHLLVEWWRRGTDTGGPPTWASWVGRDRQYTEYYALRTDADGTVSGSGDVTFREYYDLAGDPYQLTNALHEATPQQEQALGIPALAAALAADRVA